MIGRAFRYLVWLVIGFLVVSVVLVVIYRFVPPPVTATMLMDQHGITKDWTPLSRKIGRASCRERV